MQVSLYFLLFSGAFFDLFLSVFFFQLAVHCASMSGFLVVSSLLKETERLKNTYLELNLTEVEIGQEIHTK